MISADRQQSRAPSTRTLSDRCPGLLRPHLAEDGALVRLRLPGGRTTAATLVELSRIANRYGNGSGALQLTSRGNLQLRGLDTARTSALVDDVAAAGLLPSVSHERVRNIITSPLTGLTQETPDLRSMVAELDDALCATAELAELPGRFLFALDDGHRDVTTLAFDLAYLASDDTSGAVLVGGRGQGIAVDRADAVPVMIALAQRFRRLRSTLTPSPWHVAELLELIGPRVLDARIADVEAGPSGGPAPLGEVGDAASVGVPLSLLDPHQIAAIDRVVGGGPVVITPWRGVVIPGGAGALTELAAAGLITDDASVWSQLTACIGAPGCVKSAISTRGLATELAAALTVAPDLPVHVSGCARRCGSPAGRFVDLVAPTSVGHALAEFRAAR